MKKIKTGIIQEKSFRFALQIISLYRNMQEQNEYVISKQIIKSGTSIVANVEESTSGTRRKDFINKMAIASKEARETKYWIRLLIASKIIVYDF
ncbi:MAG: four helix bundle protein [Bacteroidales bacterium]|nr:four helix bundle protein [Bacteroidales bacterium]MCF8388460.1 four helix bundle protein [Bacteroidales bacterium]MCF8399196.1 four helix bundle protein [Bacteroidales bacterium]